MQLYIGNKNYSSWSMRPWVAMRQFGIPFEEVMVRFDSFEPDSRFKHLLARLSPVGKVPLLVDEGFVVWDTLAIAEYLAERFPQHALWPREPQARARARSLCAEMHSGFGALRSACPMNIEARLDDVGARIWADNEAVRRNVARIEALFADALAASGGPFLFGAFSAADAFYAPVCMRLKGYALPVSATTTDYIDRVEAAPGVARFIADALAEHDFLDFEEPYRKAP